MPSPEPEPWIFEFSITTPGASTVTPPVMSSALITWPGVVAWIEPEASRAVPTGTPVLLAPGIVVEVVVTGDVVAVGDGLAVAVDVDVGDGLVVGDELTVGDGLAVAEVVAVGDGLAVGVAVAVGVGLGLIVLAGANATAAKDQLVLVGAEVPTATGAVLEAEAFSNQ